MSALCTLLISACEVVGCEGFSFTHRISLPTRTQKRSSINERFFASWAFSQACNICDNLKTFRLKPPSNYVYPPLAPRVRKDTLTTIDNCGSTTASIDPGSSSLDPPCFSLPSASHTRLTFLPPSSSNSDARDCFYWDDTLLLDAYYFRRTAGPLWSSRASVFESTTLLGFVRSFRS